MKLKLFLGSSYRNSSSNPNYKDVSNKYVSGFYYIYNIFIASYLSVKFKTHSSRQRPTQGMKFKAEADKARNENSQDGEVKTIQILP